jgi:hypothetical protein
MIPGRCHQKQRLFCALPAENLEKSVVISTSQQFVAQPLTKFSFFEEPRIYFQRLSPLFFGRWQISPPLRIVAGNFVQQPFSWCPNGAVVIY